jgi:hypothetical protein
MDPRSYGTSAEAAEAARRAKLTSTADMKAKAACPYGCTTEATQDEDGEPVAATCDQNGYCEHLVGFAMQKRRVYEPRIFTECAWKVEEEQVEETVEINGKTEIRIVTRKQRIPTAYRESVSGSNSQPIPKGAKLVQIGNCFRVYTKEGIPDYDRFVGKVKTFQTA